MSHHRCKAIGCTQLVPARVFMCYVHWRKVPAPLQRRVTGAWRAYLAAHERGDCGDDVVALVRELHAAQEAAIAAAGAVQ